MRIQTQLLPVDLEDVDVELHPITSADVRRRYEILRDAGLEGHDLTPTLEERERRAILVEFEELEGVEE